MIPAGALLVATVTADGVEVIEPDQLLDDCYELELGFRRVSRVRQWMADRKARRLWGKR